MLLLCFYQHCEVRTEITFHSNLVHKHAKVLHQLLIVENH